MYCSLVVFSNGIAVSPNSLHSGWVKHTLHCGKQYSRISASSENQLMGQSVRFNIALCCHYESVELENVSVAVAMITPEKANNTCYGFNTFHITKTLYIRFLHMQNASVWWLRKCPLLLS